MVQRITFSLLFALLSLCMQNFMYGMHQAYRIEQGESSCLLITKENIDAYILTLKELVCAAQQNPNQETIEELNKVYCATRFTRDEDKTAAVNAIVPLLDTLIKRQDTRNMGRIACIFVGTKHNARMQAAFEQIRATRTNYQGPIEQQAQHQSWLSRHRYSLILGACAVGAITWLRYFRQTR